MGTETNWPLHRRWLWLLLVAGYLVWAIAAHVTKLTTTKAPRTAEKAERWSTIRPTANLVLEERPCRPTVLAVSGSVRVGGMIRDGFGLKTMRGRYPGPGTDWLEEAAAYFSIL